MKDLARNRCWNISLVLVVSGVYLAPNLGWAHTRLLPTGTLVPRNDLANLTGPCGVPRTTNVTQLVAGQSLKVQYEEFIEHSPSTYSISFSPANDQNFTPLATNLPDSLAGTPLPHEYATTVTVPTTPCAACTVQVIQIAMDSNPVRYYYSCADIEIVAPTGAPAPTGTVTPSPSPSSSPKPIASATPAPTGTVTPSPSPTAAPVSTTTSVMTAIMNQLVSGVQATIAYLRSLVN